MTDCPVCGKDFEELKDHIDQAHEAMSNVYSEAFLANEGASEWWSSKNETEQEQILLASGVNPLHKGLSWNNLGQENQALIKQEYYEAREAHEDEEGNLVIDNDEDLYALHQGLMDKPIKDDADEIEQHQDKPTQTHDDWQKELEGLRNQFSTEEVAKRAKEGHHIDLEDTTEYINDEKEESDEGGFGSGRNKNIGAQGDIGREPSFQKAWNYNPDAPEANEEGADDPLKKVDDLSESYRYMSRDKRAQLFESLGFEQIDSAILAGLEWNELTRPVKVEASEAYSKEFGEPEPEETGEDPEDGDEDGAYEALYNLERSHDSPDYKKKAIECSNCNEKFYNTNDRDVHFNEVHAIEQEYQLPEECPFCNQEIKEPETLDYHMDKAHNMGTPSAYTQTGIQGAMADTDFDSLESHKKAREGYTVQVKDDSGNITWQQTYNTREEAEKARRWHEQDHGYPVSIIDSEHLYESYAKEDGGYGNFGSKDKEDSWSVLTAGADLWYFNSREEAEDYVKNFPEGSYQINSPKSGRESHANEARWECLDCDSEFDDAGKHQEETGHHNIARKRANEESHEHQWEVVGDADGDVTSECRVPGCDAKLWSHPGQYPPEGDIYYGHLGEAEDSDHPRINISRYKGDGEWEKLDNLDNANEDDMDDIQYREQFGHDWWDDKARKERLKREGKEEIDGHDPEEMIEREHELTGEEPEPEEEKVHQQLKKEFGDEFGDYDVDCDCNKNPDCPKCDGKGTIAWHSTIGDDNE